MSEKSAKIRISIKDGEFELSGSELFVSQQIDSFRDLIVESLKDKEFSLQNNSDTGNVQALEEENSNQHDSQTTSTTELTPEVRNYPRVFHIDGDKIRIIKRAPGNNNARKSINTALLYLWATESLDGREITYSDIRELCKEQGCLDSKNFSAQMKSAKEYMIVDGGGKSQVLKLTLPGREKAEEIIKELNS